jgi:exopolysaccharide biosynthesis protein
MARIRPQTILMPLGCLAVLIMILLFLPLLKLTTPTVDPIPQSLTWESNEIKWYQDSKRSYILAVFTKPLDLFMQTQPVADVAEVANQQKWSLAVNGGYFYWQGSRAVHSGLLIVDGRSLFGLVNDSRQQVTHVLIHDAVAATIKMQPAHEVDVNLLKQPGITAIQSGPLILQDNIIQTELIDNSANGTGRYIRTILGTTSDGRTFVFVAKSPVTLTQSAEILLQLEPLKNTKLTAINLDGGSSTAVFSQNQEFNFFANKKLPFLLGVK